MPESEGGGVMGRKNLPGKGRADSGTDRATYNRHSTELIQLVNRHELEVAQVSINRAICLH